MTTIVNDDDDLLLFATLQQTFHALLEATTADDARHLFIDFALLLATVEERGLDVTVQTREAGDDKLE